MNFKLEKLPFPPKEFFKKFTFFGLQEINYLQIEKTEQPRIKEIFEQLYREYHQPGTPFYAEILQHNLLVLMYKCLNLFKEQEVKLSDLPKNNQLFFRFRNLINNYYLSKRTVKEYAALLNITPNHLSERIKEETGRPALQFISERLLTEAKSLLAYSDLEMKAIAYTLGFASPSHFGRFFKSHTDKTPLQYRNKTKTEK